MMICAEIYQGILSSDKARKNSRFVLDSKSCRLNVAIRKLQIRQIVTWHRHYVSCVQCRTDLKLVSVESRKDLELKPAESRKGLS